MKYKRIELEDGGVICYAKNNVNKITIVDVTFNCGARVESIPGLAHFVEHMFFSGTKTMSKEEATRKYFDFINVNAFTNAHEICFTGDIFTNELANYLSTVSTLITESTFTEKAVVKERDIILQEIAKYADDYKRQAGDFDVYNFSKDKIIDYGIIGTKDSVSSIKSKDIKSYVRKFFVKENIEIYITSPLSFNKIKKIIQRNLIDRLPSSKEFKKLNAFYFYPVNTNFVKLKSKKIDKCYIYLNLFDDHNIFEHEYKMKAHMIMRMLNDMSDGINKELRLNKSLVYNSSIFKSYTDKTSRTCFKTECVADNIRPVLETVANFIKNLVEAGFNAEQLKKAKRELQYERDREEPRASKRISKLYDFRKYGKIINTKKLQQIAKNMTLEESNEILKDIFSTHKISLSIYGDAKKDQLPTKEEFEKLFIM